MARPVQILTRAMDQVAGAAAGLVPLQPFLRRPTVGQRAITVEVVGVAEIWLALPERHLPVVPVATDF